MEKILWGSGKPSYKLDVGYFNIKHFWEKSYFHPPAFPKKNSSLVNGQDCGSGRLNGLLLLYILQDEASHKAGEGAFPNWKDDLSPMRFLGRKEPCNYLLC